MKYRTREDIKAAKAMISPPGETLLETMQTYGIKQPELSERMGRPLKTINEIINGKTAITPETALQLERVLGIPSDFWLTREQNYRLELAAISDSEKLLEAEEWVKNFPVEQMMRHGWIEETRDDLALINNLLTFFSVADTDAFRNFYSKRIDKYFHSSFRLRNDHVNSLAAWMRSADLIAHKTSLSEFRKNDLEDALQQIILLTTVPDVQEAAHGAQQILQDAGVLLVFSPDLTGNNLIGSARWIHNKPVIQMKKEYRGAGEFWFVLFHEAAHILLHGKKDIFIDDVSYVHARKEKEVEANNAAIGLLCDIEVEDELSNIEELTGAAISGVARKTNANPAVLAQCLYAKRKISDTLAGRFEQELVVG